MRQRGGHIVNIGSMLALFPNPLSAAYVAAKHGLGGLTQSVSSEAGAYGISLTLVCPGYIATNLFQAGTFEGRLRSDNVVERIPFRLMDVDTAVSRTLASKPIEARSAACHSAQARVSLCCFSCFTGR